MLVLSWRGRWILNYCSGCTGIVDSSRTLGVGIAVPFIYEFVLQSARINPTKHFADSVYTLHLSTPTAMTVTQCVM